MVLPPDMFESRILTAGPRQERAPEAAEGGDKLWGMFGRGRGEGAS
jgi:hypothetical protein